MRANRGFIFSVFFLVFILGVIGSVSAATLFFDNFNSGNSINTTLWTVNNATLSAGAAKLNIGGSIITATINAAGYNNIILSYARKTSNLQGSDNLSVEYSVDGGSTYNVIEQTENTSYHVETWNLSSLSPSATNVPNLKIRFILYGDCYAYIDNVSVTGNNMTVFQQPPLPLPTCSVDTLNNINGVVLFNLNNYYFNQTGSFYVFGSANSSSGSCVLTNVAYNQTGYPVWMNANGQPTFSPWSTNYLSFGSGISTVCCQATSSPCSEGNCQTLVGNISCKNFCLDTQVPTVNSIIDNTHDCTNDEQEYWNQTSITWNWTAQDVGCAGLKNYKIMLFYTNGTYAGQTQWVTEPTRTVTFSELSDGQNYYITIWAVDNANNMGVGLSSSDIVIDLTPPNVTITGAPTGQGIWYDPIFSVTETDFDASLGTCYYQVIDTSSGATLGWQQTSCNNQLGISVDPFVSCTHDGHYCFVEKKAIDKACNLGEANVTYNVDTHPPVVSKTVGSPKVSPWGSWINSLVNGFFIRNNTLITLTCDDGQGSGVQSISYQIDNGPLTNYTAPFTLSPDGLHSISYYCTDNVGKVSNISFETDKVDDIPPVTVKTIGSPQYNDSQGNLWVTSNTLFTLSATDSEVGCQNTDYWISYYGDSVNPETGPCYKTFNLNGPDGTFNVSYQSTDLLGNIEQLNSEIDHLDNTPPTITIWNPTAEEARDIERCSQSVVVQVSDAKSGVNDSSVYADLYYANGSEVPNHNLALKKTIYGTYEGLMDKQLPAGDYVLKIFATDNVGNQQVATINEHLSSSVFVEYIYPSSCSVNPQKGGVCNFTFDVCMRGGSNIQFWMNKLGEIITPDMMNATIGNGNSNTFVGLKHDDFTSDAGILSLGGCDFNGRTNFTLSLNLNTNVTQAIGPGAHDLNYHIESSECVPPVND